MHLCIHYTDGMKHVLSIIIVSLALTACSGGSGNYVKDKQFGHWQVVVPENKHSGLCYAFANPVDSDEEHPPYAMITRRNSGKMEFSTTSGFDCDASSKVKLRTGKRIFILASKNRVAWAQNDKLDAMILGAIQNEDEFRISSVKNGSTIVDHYDTEGLNEALEQVKAICP